MFGFVFLKLQTSFSPVPKDRGSMTLKEFVTDRMIFFSIDKSQICRRKMVHRKHVHTYVIITSVR